MSKKILLKPLKVIASPGIYLFYKFSQYKRQRTEQTKRKLPEKQLAELISELNSKIDKLLIKLDDKEGEVISQHDEECVICINAKAVMRTYPCGHKVVCRKCFLKTIQSALSQRSLPLKCVVCRTKIVRLKRSSGKKCHWRLSPEKNLGKFNFPNSRDVYAKWKLDNDVVSSMGGKTWIVPNVASRHTVQQHGFQNRTSNSPSLLMNAKSSPDLTNKLRQAVPIESHNKTKTAVDNSTSAAKRRSPINSAILQKRDENIPKNKRSNSDATKSEKNITGGKVCRDELIRRFQRDFREGKQISSGCNKQIRYQGKCTRRK